LKEPRIYRKLAPVAGLNLHAALGLVLALVPVTDEDARAALLRIVPKVAAARGLGFHGPLPARAMPAAEIRRALVGSLGGADTARQDAILRRLGLLPADGDSAELALATFAASPLPHYDPVTRRLLVPDAPALDKQELLIAHEVAHAIADERFGIRRTLGIAADGRHELDGDAERARLAVIEGDATLATLTFAEPRETFLGARELASVADRLGNKQPGWLAALSRFTHIDGLLFTARVRARKPWSAVNALWADPPASTEQVLHPEKYEACEAPVAVDLSLFPTLSDVGAPTTTDVLGELVVRSWLAKSLALDLAERAATGWGGDRAALYRVPPPAAPGSTSESPLLAWLTIWDDAADAADFVRAAKLAGATIAERRADAVALLFGARDDASRLTAALLDGWRDLKTARQKLARRARPAPATCARADR
jgi:hypothetical protein